MPALVFAAPVVLDMLAAAAYGAAFAWPSLTRTSRAAFALAAVGLVVHGIAIGAGCKETGGQRLLTVSGAVGLLGWVAGGVLLLVQRACRDPAAGAFALPLVLAAVLPGVFAPGTGGRGVTPALATVPALRLHATAAAAGIAWRLRETSRPVSMRKIVGPPLGMSTGLAMFLAPAARVRWAWAGVAEIG